MVIQHDNLSTVCCVFCRPACILWTQNDSLQNGSTKYFHEKRFSDLDSASSNKLWCKFSEFSRSRFTWGAHLARTIYTRLAPILLILRQDLFDDVLLPWVSNVYITAWGFIDQSKHRIRLTIQFELEFPANENKNQWRQVDIFVTSSLLLTEH